MRYKDTKEEAIQGNQSSQPIPISFRNDISKSTSSSSQRFAKDQTDSDDDFVMINNEDADHGLNLSIIEDYDGTSLGLNRSFFQSSSSTKHLLPVTVGSPPASIQAVSTTEAFSELLRKWVVKTKISIAIIGSQGVGKNFLANSLLEATFQDGHFDSSNTIPSASSPTEGPLDKDFFLVEEDEEFSSNMAVEVSCLTEIFKFSYVFLNSARISPSL
jgi:hypothetical protein